MVKSSQTLSAIGRSGSYKPLATILCPRPAITSWNPSAPPAAAPLFKTLATPAKSGVIAPFRSPLNILSKGIISVAPNGIPAILPNH